jgi:hypothetical protein
MNKILLLASLIFYFSASGQDETIKALKSDTEKKIKKDPADTAAKTWKRGGIYGLNISQGSLSNWAAGGDEFSLSVNSLLSLYAFYKKGKSSWDNTFDFNLGYVKTTSLGSRKNDDRFDLMSKYGHALNKKFSLAGIFNIRSQFFKGYIFPNNVKTYSSSFMAPGYILLGVGIDYKPTTSLSLFLSPLTARWVIVRDTALSNKGLYGVTPGKKSAFEYGAFASINFFKELSKSLTFKSRLDLFSNYRRHPEKIDLFMSNVLNAKISKLLSATWGLDLIYDDDVKLFGPNGNEARLQVKSLVGVGLLVKFE